jgi:hypothetical protein
MHVVAKQLIAAMAVAPVLLIGGEARAAAIRTLPTLNTLTFIEQTGSAHNWTFGKDSAELTTRLPDPLEYSARLLRYDFYGARLGTDSGNYSELYDVFYSDAAGNLDINGAYVTIEAVWPRYLGYFPDLTTPVGGGLNITEVYLTFLDSTTEYADTTSSFVAFGGNQVAGSFGNATDGSSSTWTTMGNTIQPDHPDRLRITVGFASSREPSVIPEPATVALFSAGLAALGALRRRRTVG